jgi:hypothetical protein
MTCGYRFVLEVQSLDGAVLRREGLTPDWEPALEAARLVGLRTLGLWPQVDEADPRLEPLWHDAAGEPNLRGFRIRLEHDGQAWFADLPAAKYFSETARSVVAAALAEGVVRADESVRYGVAAYVVETDLPRPSPLRFDAADRPAPLEVHERGLDRLVARARACADIDATDVDVVLPEDVLDEVCRLTVAADERETGGLLLGHLCHCDNGADIGLEVTAQVPARHTIGDAVKLTFTSDTWTDARAALALRKRGELLIGWWHSHPAQGWCKSCPVERQRVCQLSAGFLSADDRALHRAMFPAAYTQALLVTNSVNGLDTKLFGWKNGLLQSRGFWLLDGTAADSVARRSIRGAASVTVAACATGSRGETDAP